MRLDSGQIEVVDSAMAEVLQRKTPAQRIHIGFAMWDSAKRMLTSHLSTEHPDWDAQRVQREVVRRLSHGVA
jgi:hypothetical protein